MVQEKKVSIIVPVYNVESYIHECINSILRQTYTNYELLLIDDGSPDSCPQICDYYSSIDKRIRVFHTPNGGLSAARNHGLQNAIGDYVVFVDSDDFIDENMIGILVARIENSCSDVVSCLARRVDEKSRVINNSPLGIKWSYGTFDGVNAIKNMFRRKCDVSAWGKIHRREVLCNFQFKEGRLNEDVLFYFNLFQVCKKVCFIDDVLYNYRQRNESITSHFGRSNYDMLTNMEEMCHSEVIDKLGLKKDAKFYECWCSITFCRGAILAKVGSLSCKAFFFNATNRILHNLLFIIQSSLSVKMKIWAIVSICYRFKVK